MQRKTEVKALAGQQEILVTRDFALPVELVFRAYTEADLLEQWMGNKVLKLENRAHGGYILETRDDQGNLLFRANGAIHGVEPNRLIVRTFEMENVGFPARLEFLQFEPRGETQSRLTMQMIFKSIEDRDMQLRMPFAEGINGAHRRLEEIMNPLFTAKDQ